MKNHLIAFILLSKSLASAEDSETGPSNHDSETDKNEPEMIKTLFHHTEP